jgi:hypothetical protein
MQAFNSAAEMIQSQNLQGPSDLYAAMLTVKNGFANGQTALGCYTITKAQAKRAGIDWSFVVSSAQLLGLKLENRHGRHGHMVSK